MAAFENFNVDHTARELRIHPRTYTTLVKVFAHHMRRELQRIEEALKRDDIETVRRILHQLKGTAANLRLNKIVRAEGVFHVAVTSSDNPQSSWKHFQNLKKETDDLIRYIERFPSYKIPDQEDDA